MMVRKFDTYLKAWTFGRESGYPFEVKRGSLWEFYAHVDVGLTGLPI